MLQACLNGGRGDPAPATPDQIATDARDAVVAGASELHIHPRGPDGAESLEPTHVGACLDAVRQAVPGVPVGIGTGTWIAPGGVARHAHMKAWTVKPDYVSVNLGEADAPEVMALVAGQGIGIEAGIWSRADAARFNALDLPTPLRILVEMQDVAPETARAEAEAVLAMLPDGVPVLLHGLDRSAWAMIDMAAALGLDTRVGLEDVTQLPDGTPATNAQLVTWAAQVLDRA